MLHSITFCFGEKSIWQHLGSRQIAGFFFLLSEKAKIAIVPTAFSVFQYPTRQTTRLYYKRLVNRQLKVKLVQFSDRFKE